MTRLSHHAKHVVSMGAFAALSLFAAEPPVNNTSPYATWENGPSAEGSHFPIAVWLQEPELAKRYQEAGINLYVGLWKGPTEAHLAALKEAGMKVICEQNEVGLKHLADPTIVGWMHGDEPDNAQSLGQGKGYGPPIKPEKIVADYQRIRKADPSRPVMLNLGQGVAWDKWHGRGVRTNHPEDYPEYMKGGDIISFDIYPATHDKPDVKGNLWYVAQGVERLVKWGEGRKIVWNCIECTRIGADSKPTPAQIQAEVWMALIRGSRGLIYFVHEWAPKFNEHALLDDPVTLKAVTTINQQIAELAPVLNSPTLADAATVTPSKKDVPIAIMAKRFGDATYLFAISLRAGETKATFTLKDLAAAKAEVLGEQRERPVKDGLFEDVFVGYGVHLYRIR